MANEEALGLTTDVPISDLESASKINPSDLFVLEQDGVAKNLSGQLLISYVMSLMGGHGSITKIEKVKTEGLVDTYRITMEDGSLHEYSVTNGERGPGFYQTPANKTSTSQWLSFDEIMPYEGYYPVVHDMVLFSDYSLGTVSEVDKVNRRARLENVTGSLQGGPGENGKDANIYVRYASQKPSESAPSFGDVPDKWMGIASGTMTTAPTDWRAYKWMYVQGIAGESIHHTWYGTKLRITSASGTSEADLIGHVGPQGARGIPGKIQTINGYEPNPETGDMVLGAGHKIDTSYQKFMDAPVTFITSIAIVNGLGSAQIVAGNLYHVTWRDTLYECRAQMYGGSVCLGNLGYFGGPDTGEPFVFEVSGDLYSSLTKSNSNRETINVKVERPESVEYITIPKEYMPEDLYQRIAALEAKVGIG